MPNSQFLDILLFAVVAGVILFRLYTVLGRRTGNERPPQESYRLSGADAAPPKDNVVPLPVAARAGRLPTSWPIRSPAAFWISSWPTAVLRPITSWPAHEAPMR